MGTRVGTRTEREDTRGDVDRIRGCGWSVGTGTEHGDTHEDVDGARGHVQGRGDAGTRVGTGVGGQGHGGTEGHRHEHVGTWGRCHPGDGGHGENTRADVAMWGRGERGQRDTGTRGCGNDRTRRLWGRGDKGTPGPQRHGAGGMKGQRDRGDTGTAGSW